MSCQTNVTEIKKDKLGGLKGLGERRHPVVQRLVDQVDLRVEQAVDVARARRDELKEQVVQRTASRVLDLANRQAEWAFGKVGVDLPELKHQAARYGRVGLHLAHMMAQGTETMMGAPLELTEPRVWQDLAEINAFKLSARNRSYKAAGIRVELHEWNYLPNAHEIDKTHLRTLAEALYIIRTGGPLDLATFEQASFGEPGFRVVGRQLLRMAGQLAHRRHIDLVDVYANRLRTIESDMEGPRSAAADRPQPGSTGKATWAQLGMVQHDHDQRFRPDLFVDKDHPERHLAHARGLVQLYHHGVESLAGHDSAQYRDHLGEVVICGLRLANFMDPRPLPKQPVNIPHYSALDAWPDPMEGVS